MRRLAVFTEARLCQGPQTRQEREDDPLWEESASVSTIGSRYGVSWA